MLSLGIIILCILISKIRTASQEVSDGSTVIDFDLILQVDDEHRQQGSPHEKIPSFPAEPSISKNDNFEFKAPFRVPTPPPVTVSERIPVSRPNILTIRASTLRSEGYSKEFLSLFQEITYTKENLEGLISVFNESIQALLPGCDYEDEFFDFSFISSCKLGSLLKAAYRDQCVKSYARENSRNTQHSSVHQAAYFESLVSRDEPTTWTLAEVYLAMIKLVNEL